MATLSFADLKETALPSLWDSGEIEKVRLADGTTSARWSLTSRPACVH